MNELKYFLFYLDDKITLKPGTDYTIGRGGDNQIILPDQTTSRHHARIVWKEKHFVIEDLGSTNGIFVNGRKSVSRILYDGDHIAIGTFYLVYKELIGSQSGENEFECTLSDTILIEHQISKLLKSISDKKIRDKLIDLKTSMNKVKSRLDRLANRDRLTGLYNRRYFDEELKKEFQRARRYKFSILLFMIDVDDFKKINDSYGHQKGDRVLSAVASIISERTRVNDLVARYGGEEFVVVVPEISSGNSANIAEKIRKEIENLSLKKTGLQVTVSIGCASTNNIADTRDIMENRSEKIMHASGKESDTPESLIQKADKALYEAKRNGKNRVVLYKSN